MLNRRITFFLLIIGGFLFACRPTRHLSDGEYLLVKNKIKTDTSILSSNQFDYCLKQKPNRKILWLFRFHLGVYNLGSSGTDSKFKSWLKNIGEEPVIFDSTLTEKSKQQCNVFLSKNGFFNAYVSDSVHYRKKKAVVTYHIKYNKPYTINSIIYSTQDAGISPMINYLQQSSLIIPGERYDEELLEKERERITSDLKDRGYYFFNRNYITIQIDTSLKNNKADIYLYINRINENVVNTDGSVYPIIDHHPYNLRNIYFYTDFNTLSPDSSVKYDTLNYEGVYILSNLKSQIIRNNVLVRNLFVKSGDRYLQRDLDYTYKRLQDLNLYKFINLNLKEVPRDSIQDKYLLDLHIQLTPTDKQDFTLETDATNTGGNIGIAGSMGYRNKNTFRGAEVLEIKIRGGLEAIPNYNNSAETKRLYFFNTYEIGPEISLSLKKFLLPPFLERKTSRYASPKTNIVLGYNLEERPDYRRTITNFSLSYIFSPTSRQRFIFYFPDLNAVRVNLSSGFQAKLDTLNDPRLNYAYETHMITSTHLTWIYTDQKPDAAIDFIYFRISGELAVKAFISELRPSQYAKADYDLSYHHYVDRFNNIVFRIASGYGLPYGSSTALPFEKSFFSGGANSIRAWVTRSLGPGSYKNDIYIEQSGDIKFESNIEYRSQIFRFMNGIILEAASFVDAGNIWTRNEDPGRPGAKFEASKAISELGIGAGAGLRFNFSFFIFRLDAAAKIRNPALEEGNRWVFGNEKFGLVDVNWNLAIGYPF